jgi:hypothetical protein
VDADVAAMDGSADVDADLAAGEASLVEAEAGQASSRPCPDSEGGGSPLPTCDPSNQNQVCEFSSGYAICVDGTWLDCTSHIQNGFVCLSGDASAPTGSLCCPKWYYGDIGSNNNPYEIGMCCNAGRQATCANHHLKYGGTCGAFDAGLDGAD